jgi:hypothetical protein
VQNIPQQACLSQVRRKLRNGLRQQAAQLAPRAAFFGILLLRGNAATQCLFAFTLPLIQGSDLPVASLPQKVD